MHDNSKAVQAPLCLWLRPRAVRSETQVSRPDRRRQSTGHQVTTCWPVPGISPAAKESGAWRGPWLCPQGTFWHQKAQLPLLSTDRPKMKQKGGQPPWLTSARAQPWTESCCLPRSNDPAPAHRPAPRLVSMYGSGIHRPVMAASNHWDGCAPK